MNENTGHHSNDQKAMKIAKHDEHTKKKIIQKGGDNFGYLITQKDSGSKKAAQCKAAAAKLGD